jgi:hypothetical protein
LWRNWLSVCLCFGALFLEGTARNSFGLGFISVFGGNGIASVFSEETALCYHFLRERHCVTVFGGNSKEQRCIRVYQRNGVAWGFTERTALFEGLPKERRYMGLYWWNGIAWASSRWQAVWKRL